jgi:type VI secretion system protein VasD
MMRWVRLLLLGLVLGAGLFGCGSKPPPPSIVELTFKAGQATNPDANNRPSPVILRIYQLAATGSFEKADFFQLYDKEAATLGADLLGREQIALAPGDSKAVTLEFKPQATFVGIIAAFRSIDRATWRIDAPVAPGKTTKLTVTVDGLVLKLEKAGS